MLQPILTENQIINLWEQIHIGGMIPDELAINNDIINSWRRSAEYKIDPLTEKCERKISKKELNKRLDAYSELLEVALPQMYILYSLTKEAGFIITLIDNQGVILVRIGETDILDFSSHHNFIEGYDWSEEVMGTNAAGLPLVLDKPIHVFGYEHYCRCNCLSTCSASPIHDDAGNIIAVLDLTAPYNRVNAHTLAMVVASARTIEQNLILDKLYKEVQTANGLKTAIMNSISEGMIALDLNHQITLINSQAHKMLNIDSKYIIGKNIMDVLPLDNDYFFKLVKSSSSHYGETVTIRTVKGEKKFVINFSPIPISSDSFGGNVIILNELRKVVNKIVGAQTNITFDNLIGQNLLFKEAIEQAKLAAENNSNVLLLGESGVGKDLFAKSIHNASMRKNEPFLAINCAAIPRELIASELFGYSEGAFTGARKGGKPGIFELADQGTVFLDEIGEMPIDLQASLLRVLEDKSILRLGGQEIIPINVRLISATNRNLNEEIKNGNFRQEIFYRLSVMTIYLPPLRKRRDDILLLAEHFVNNMSKRLGKPILKISNEVMDILMNYEWPGNIRELSNVIERAVNLAKGNVITVEVLPKEIFNDNTPGFYSIIMDDNVTKDIMEAELIKKYLAKFNNNKSLVAKAMDISRSSLYRKMEKYDIF